MMLIDAAWDRVRTAASDGGYLRIDPAHPGDFFAAEDSEGRKGLVLLLDAEPKGPPKLESLEVAVSQRPDGRWVLSVYLHAGALLPPFTQLCEDLIESSRHTPREQIGSYVVARLHRWHDLLEGAHVKWSMSKLRGFIGELRLLDMAAATHGLETAVGAWAGPYSAPQDFTLPGQWIEVKATYPTARTVRITSSDQLAAPGELLLAVFTFATLVPGHEGISALGLVTALERKLAGDGIGAVLLEFGKRLSVLSFDRTAEYATVTFREDAVHFFEVAGDFPRITPSDMPAGVAEVMYDVELGALTPFEVAAPF
jgi:hypothetical protein